MRTNEGKISRQIKKSKKSNDLAQKANNYNDLFKHSNEYQDVRSDMYSADNQALYKSDSISLSGDFTSCSIKTDVTYNNQIIRSAIFQTECPDHLGSQMNYYGLNVNYSDYNHGT